MTGLLYEETYDEAYINDILCALGSKGINKVILTGVSYEPDTTGIVIYEDGKYDYYKHERLNRLCHGTGDIFASAFTGAYLKGHSLYEAAKIAGDFVLKCIKNTADDDSHWYGVKFEPVLGELIKAV